MPSTIVRWSSIHRAAGSTTGRPVCFRRPALHGENPQAANNTYLALGLAHCFEKDETGKLLDVYVIEPLPATSLECMATGSQTSFKHVLGTTLGAALEKERSQLPEEFGPGLFCEDFDTRCQASARTWLRSHAQDSLINIVPLDQMKSDFNYSTELKRVLNFENVVSDEDNIKQDMSIDVYGRQEKQETEEKAKVEAEAHVQEEEEEEDIEGFLAG